MFVCFCWISGIFFFLFQKKKKQLRIISHIGKQTNYPICFIVYVCVCAFNSMMMEQNHLSFFFTKLVAVEMCVHAWKTITNLMIKNDEKWIHSFTVCIVSHFNLFPFPKHTHTHSVFPSPWQNFQNTDLHQKKYDYQKIVIIFMMIINNPCVCV